MKFNMKLDLATYGALVDNIVEKYFNDAGEFEPHVGIINAMCLFYNQCVMKDELPEGFPERIDNMMEIEAVAENEEFISTFNNVIDCYDGIGINFQSAYCAAMEIVNDKKTSIGRIITVVGNGIKKVVNELENGLTPEMAENISKLTSAIGNDGNLAEAIVKEYGKMAFKN